MRCFGSHGRPAGPPGAEPSLRRRLCLDSERPASPSSSSLRSWRCGRSVAMPSHFAPLHATREFHSPPSGHADWSSSGCVSPGRHRLVPTSSHSRCRWPRVSTRGERGEARSTFSSGGSACFAAQPAARSESLPSHLFTTVITIVSYSCSHQRSERASVRSHWQRQLKDI